MGAEQQWVTEWELAIGDTECDDWCGSISDGCEIACHEIVQPQNCGTGPAPWSPIIVDLRGTGYDLVGLGAGVQFDHDGDGETEITGWTSGDGGNAFLHLDLNNNGVVDSGRELFGNNTLLANGETASHGFEALAMYANLPRVGTLTAALHRTTRSGRFFDSGQIATKTGGACQTKS